MIKKNKKYIAVVLVAVVAISVLAFTYLKINRKQSFEGLLDSQKEIGKVIDKKGIHEAYIFFTKNYPNYDPATKHYLGHYLGQRAYELLGDSGIEVCSYNFDYGCVHGLVIQGIAENGTDYISTTLDKCLSMTSVDEFKKESCVHGVSHTLLSLSQYTDNDLEYALEKCDQFLEHDDPTQCYSATFMEFNLHSLNGSETGEWYTLRNFDEEKPLYPCESIDTKYQKACFSELGSFWSNVMGADFNKMGDFCISALRSESKVTCFWGVGRSMADLYQYSTDKITDKCDEISGEYSYSCLYGAAIVLFSNEVPDAVRICESTEPKHRKSCDDLSKVFQKN